MRLSYSISNDAGKVTAITNSAVIVDTTNANRGASKGITIAGEDGPDTIVCNSESSSDDSAGAGSRSGWERTTFTNNNAGYDQTLDGADSSRECNADSPGSPSAVFADAAGGLCNSYHRVRPGYGLVRPQQSP